MAFNSLIRQLLTVDGSIGVEYLASELIDDGAISRLTGNVELVCQSVGLKEVSAAVGEHASDSGLAAGYAAGETYAEHASSILRERFRWSNIGLRPVAV